MEGFTLIEIMVVFAIVALLAGGVRAGVSIAAQGGSARGDDAAVRRDALPVRSRLDHGQDPPSGDRHGAGSYWAEVSDDRFFIPREAETEEELREREEKEAEDDEEEREEARAGRARGRERQVGVRQLELRPVEAGGRRLSSQARAVRLVQGPGAQAGEAQEDEGPERLHPSRHRAADQRARLHLFLPARADRAGDRHDVGPGGQDRVFAGRAPDHRARAHLQPGGRSRRRARPPTTTKANG